MTEQTSLDEILNNEPQEEEIPESSELRIDEEQAQAEARERDERGRFVAKGEKQEAEAPPAPQEEGNIPIAALKDERAKRQALEAELQQLHQYLAQQQQQPQVVPDQWEDPEGFQQFLTNEAVSRAVAAAEQKAVETFSLQRIANHAAEYRADKPDYEQAINVFGQMAQVNPMLIGQMQAARNPAEFAYETAKLQMEIAQHGGIEGLVNARIEARMQNQQAQYADVQNRLPSSAPPTISTDRSVGARSGPAWTGPSPLADLLR